MIRIKDCILDPENETVIEFSLWDLLGFVSLFVLSYILLVFILSL